MEVVFGAGAPFIPENILQYMSENRSGYFVNILNCGSLGRYFEARKGNYLALLYLA